MDHDQDPAPMTFDVDVIDADDGRHGVRLRVASPSHGMSWELAMSGRTAVALAARLHAVGEKVDVVDTLTPLQRRIWRPAP